MIIETVKKSNNTKLKITLDILSVLSGFWFLVGAFIWSHYFPNIRDTNGNLAISIKLSLFNVPMSLLGAAWLISRYSALIRKKYTFVTKLWFLKTLPFGIPFLYFVVYIILKNTLWG